MRQTDSLPAIEARLAGLVHESARGDPGERGRHERFVIGRMAAGALALALIPPYLLWREAPSAGEYLVLAALAGPLFAAAILARTGLFALAQAVVSTALAAPIVGVAAAADGIGLAAAPLLALPAEALLFGSRRAVIPASVVAVLSLLAIAVLGGIGPAPQPWLMAPALALVAIGHAAAALLAPSRREAAPDPRSAEDRSFLRAIDDLITWHDRNGHVLEASASAAKLVGVPAAALKGRGLFSRVHVPDRPAFLRAVSEAAGSARAAAVQFRLHVGSGPGDGREAGPEVVWVEMRAHRLDDAPSDAVAPAVVAVTRTVAEHKRREEELDRARAEAERADLAKGRFLASVSHELRTPLNAIIGFSELLAAEVPRGSGGEKRREYAGIVRDSGRHLLDVAGALLDLSRIETGDFPFAPEPIEVAELVRGCCDLMRLEAERAGVRLVCGVDADLPELVADRRACRQILINLLSNAVKFTPRGGEARVEATREGDRIVLTVADTGIGVSASELPRLGDPFFQAAPAVGRSRDGAGLGLSVVRGLVEVHRGSLAFESAGGGGTRVTVGLPIEPRSGAPGSGCADPVTTLSRPRERAPAKVRFIHG